VSWNDLVTSVALISRARTLPTESSAETSESYCAIGTLTSKVASEAVPPCVAVSSVMVPPAARVMARKRRRRSHS